MSDEAPQRHKEHKGIPFVVGHWSFFIGHFGLLVFGDCLFAIGYLESRRMVRDEIRNPNSDVRCPIIHHRGTEDTEGDIISN